MKGHRGSFEEPTMTRRLALTLLSTSLVLPACVIDHDLGETAADEGTSGSDSDDSTGPDPSATSGQTTGPGDSSGSAEVTTSPGNPTDPSDTQTDTGEPGDCEPGELWVQWADPFPDPMPGIDPTFAAVLSGSCTLSGMFSSSLGGQFNQWELYLDCTLSGRVDGDGEIVDQAFMPTIAGTSAIPAEQWLPFLDEQPLQLRVVLDHWGMGWSRYLVLERDSTVVLDMVDGEYVDPLDGLSWTDDIMQLLEGEPWHGPLTASTEDAYCGQGVGKCGQSPRALELGWAGGETIGLHDGEDDFFGTAVPELSYHASVASAQDLSMPLCTDMPLGDYRFSVWAEEG